MKRFVLLIIIVPLFLISCSKDIKRALNMPNGENLTENNRVQANDKIKRNRNGRVIYCKDRAGNEKWYDSDGKLTHSKDSNGNEDYSIFAVLNGLYNLANLLDLSD